MRYTSILFGTLLLAATLLGAASAHAAVADDIAAKNRQIADLQQQIADLEAQATAVGQRSRTLENEIAKLNANISRIQLEVRQLDASIDRTGLEIQQTEAGIQDAERTIGLHQDALARYLRERYDLDQRSLAQVLLQYGTLSEFSDYIHQVQQTQDHLTDAIRVIRELRGELDVQHASLEDRRGELEQLKALQEVQQRQLASAKNGKNSLLKETKGEESKFQSLISQSKTNLKLLQEQIYYLQQNGINVQDAATYAKLAAVGAGIRPAFLLALLEVESRLGQNIGKGNWRDDMYLCYLRLRDIAKTADRKAYYQKRADTEKNAYFATVTPLGLDPDAQKVSKEPSYGCGGAMGPAQFIPSTWLSYAKAVIALTGRPVANPWNTEDAFTAAAIKLARGGASSKTPAGERAAAKAYISGNPNCTQAICNSYSSTILQKAAEIEKNL